MTVSNTTVKTSSAGDGSLSSFAIGSITFSDNADLDVYIRDETSSPATEALKTITTHYYITDSAGNQVNPGTHIKFDTGDGHTLPITDQHVVVKRKIELTQSTDYSSGDAFPADSHEDALDRLTLQVQQLQEQLDRNSSFPETYTVPGSIDTTMPEPEADGILKWNATATALVMDTDLVNSTYKLYASNTSDTTAGFLNDKLAAGTGLAKSATTGATNQQVTLSIDLKDEDNMASNSASHAASQQSIKAYVDAVTTSLAAQDLDFTTDTVGNSAVDLDTQVMTFAGGEGVDVTHFGQTITVAGEDASTSNKGVASFNSDSFSASSGAISVKSGAILDAPVLKATSNSVGGKILFKEGTDGGTNSVTLQGPATTADVTVTLPASADTLVGKATTDTLTNKTFDLGGTGNSLTGSLAEFNTALQSESFCSLTGSETLTNKVLTTPTIAGPTLSATSNSVGGKILFKEGTDNGTNAVTLQGPASTADVTVTLPASTDTLVGKATTDTLTNKTITAPTISAPVLSATSNSVGGKILFKEGTDNGTNSVTLQGPASTADVTVTLPASADTLVGKATTDTLTNKTLTTPTIAGPTLSATSTTVGGKILFKEGTDNGTNAVTLQGPASTADVTVTLPAAATTLIGDDTTNTLTNKTHTSPKINEDVALTATSTELNLLDGVSGLAQADFTKLAAVDSTAAELNLLDGSAKSTSSITIADTDAFIVIDGTTTKQIPASDISTYAGGSVAGTPAGAIIASGSTSVPSGYFYCDGSAVSRSTYNDLFSAIDENYGHGDNSSTYNLPDLRGYFLRGQDDGSSHDTDDSGRSALATGGNTGDNIGSFQDDGTAINNLSVSSSVSDPGHSHSLYNSIAAGGSVITSSPTIQGSPQAGTASNSTGISVSTSLSSSDNETRPKNVYVRYYIKY